jgi:diguanylate cyclase (GGDEF)-like protein/putative nucleotidyltransferase with HDIG domain
MHLLTLSAEVPGHEGAAAEVEARLRARALAGLFASGATLALVTMLLPHTEEANEPGTLVIISVAYLVALGLVWRGERVDPWMLPAALGIGTAMITGVAYFSASSPSPLIFFYLWIFLYSAYFFDDRTTLLELGFAALSSGVLLLALPPSGGTAVWWLVAMGTLLTSAVLIRTMRRRVEWLIGSLYDTARTDQLTALPNRHGFRELLDLELERARRRETRLAVLVGDLDNFKELNDRSGHHVGDAVLTRVARLLEGSKRSSDTIARVGGGEFTLILPDTDEAEALMVAERLRSELAREFADDVGPVTISFGIATYPRHGGTAGSLLRAGDEAVFGAKRHGRNRSMIHTAELHRSLEESGGARDIEGERFTAAMLDLAEAVDLRFSGSARHSETVGRYAEMVAIELGLPREHVARVRLAGVLHDIGKVMVPESILKKPGRLNDAEFEIIRRHPEFGAQILDHPALADVRAWVGSHHERPDGTGYPRGIDDSELPLEPRILAVADAYEAMTSDRSYQASIGHEAARAELERCSGSQFDPRVVGAFLAIVRRESERATEALAAGR